MDRSTTYPGAIPLDADIMKPQRNAVKGLGAMAAAVLGAGPFVDGLRCIPTVPSSLSLQVLAGSIYSTAVVDQNSYGSLGTDNHTIVKQGISEDTVTFTFTPPGTSGFAVDYIIQAQQTDVDVDNVVLAYYNAANPAAPFLGPNNSGDSQPTRRQSKLALAIKQGVAALAGTQTTPTPDDGYTALYKVTVAYGATTLDANTITQLSTAPFINPKLPAVPKASQTGKWNYAVAGGTANALTATLNPVPDTLGSNDGGFPIRLKIASNNTGAATLNVNGFGAVSIKKPTGSVLSGGELVAGSVVELVFDGSVWFLQTAQATNTNTSTGGLTTVATSDPIFGDGTSGNPIDCRDGSKTQNGVWRGATVAEFNAGNSQVVVTPDLLAGMGPSSPIVTNIKNVLGVSGIEVIDKTIVNGDPNSYTFDVTNYALFCVQFGAMNQPPNFGGIYIPWNNVQLIGATGVFTPNQSQTPISFNSLGPDGVTTVFQRMPKGSVFGDGLCTLPDSNGNVALITGTVTQIKLPASYGFLRLIGVRRLVL